MSVEQYEATPVELMHGVAIATPLHPARWLLVNNGDDHCLSLLESAVELSNRGMHKLALRECRYLLALAHCHSHWLTLTLTLVYCHSLSHWHTHKFNELSKQALVSSAE